MLDKKLFCTIKAILLAGFISCYSLALAGTSGSYAHPGIKGGDSPAKKLEGSSKKGRGPGVVPSVKPEGSKGKKGLKRYPHKREGSAKKPGHHYSKSHHGKARAGHPHGLKSGGYGGKHGHKVNPFAHILKFKDKLCLSKEQVAKIKDKKFEYAKFKIRNGADHMLAHMELDRLVHSGELNPGKMREIGQTIAGIKAKSITAMVEAKIALLSLLSEKQRGKIANIHSK